MGGRVLRWVGMVFLFLALSFWYLHPASSLLISGNEKTMLGDGTDMAALPFQYGLLIDRIHTHISDLFFGAIYTDQLNPPGGYLVWITWIEKALVLIFSQFLSIHQLATAIAFSLFTLNGLSFYGLGRLMKWPRWVSLGLAIGWAFNAFTRARVSVHLAMAGTYFLPCVFAGIIVLGAAKRPRDRVFAALLFVLSLTSIQYFTVSLVLLTPFLIGFAWLWFERKRWRNFHRHDAFVLLIPILFLLWTVLRPAPEAQLKMATQMEPPPLATELFMDVFGAHPIDYLSSDLKHGPRDWNPIRQKINEGILANLGQGNEHERSHGIRWSLLALSVCAVATAFRKRGLVVFDKTERKLIFLFFGMGLLGFWSSLSPESLELFGIRWSPFLIVHAIMKQFRVPCRFSVIAQFSAIMVTGVFLSAWARQKKHSAWRFGLVFSAVMLVDFIPLQPVKTFKVLPAVTSSEAGDGKCGTGLFFPYLSGTSAEIGKYYFSLQILRQTTCRTSNLPFHDDRNLAMLDRFSIQKYNQVLGIPQGDQEMSRQLVRFASCSGLDWIYFRLEVKDHAWRKDVCDKLGWTMVSERVCRSPAPSNKFDWNPVCLSPAAKEPKT